LPFTSERTITLLPTHSVKGNPNRFREGPIEVRLDDEWHTTMRSTDHYAVTARTWPLLARYGYVASHAPR
jgi:hypothetical protein